MESIYNGLLFVLAIWGALRAGIWIANRGGWAWYWKILAGLVITATIGSFAQQLYGDPKSDLRIVTEILASAGCVFAVEFGFRHVADNRWRAVFVAVAGVFLYFTWTETLDRAMGTVKAAAPTTISAPATYAPAASTTTRTPGNLDPLCDEVGVPFDIRKDLGCPGT